MNRSNRRVCEGLVASIPLGLARPDRAIVLHDCYGNDLVIDQDRTYPPTMTLHAWGCEAHALPSVLRKAADAAEAALKAEEAAWNREAA